MHAFGAPLCCKDVFATVKVQIANERRHVAIAEVAVARRCAAQELVVRGNIEREYIINFTTLILISLIDRFDVSRMP
jgi:hypothetical protein